MTNETIIRRAQERAHEGFMPCIAAHAVAWETGATPQEVADTLNELDIRVTQCQLGLFGFGPKAEGKSKLVRPMPAIDPTVKARLEAKAPKGVISCQAVWDIAHDLRIERLIVGNTADAMGLRIMPCQLKCF
jgi:hypothetical protein